MMPSDPTSHLVMIHADFTFGFFEDSFNRPSHSTNPSQLSQWNADRRITEKVFDLRGIVQIAANDQPELTSRQATARFRHTQKCKITNDGTFAAFFDNSPNPVLLLNFLHQLLDWNWMLSGIAQTQASGVTSVTAPLGKMNLWRSTPDQAVLLDGCEVRLSCSRHAISKRGAVPIQGICRHPDTRPLARSPSFPPSHNIEPPRLQIASLV